MRDRDGDRVRDRHITCEIVLWFLGYKNEENTLEYLLSLSCRSKGVCVYVCVHVCNKE